MKVIKNQVGFLLLDSLFGILVTSVALVSIVGLVSMGFKSYTVNNEQTRAYQIASSYGDALQSLSIATWASIIPDNTNSYKIIDADNDKISDYLANAKNSLSLLSGANVTLYGRISTEAAAANAGDRVAQVKIVVSWSNKSKQIELIKYYIRNKAPNSP